MDYRNLGRTGVKVSPICLGTMNFGHRTDEVTSIQMIHHALDQGVNFVDTADIYSRGASEVAVGKALNMGGRRSKVVLATKFFNKMDEHDPNSAGMSRRLVISACEASLKRLGTDWIDLYQIHKPYDETPIDEPLRALDDLVRQGKVRYLGTTTFPAWRLVEALWVSKEYGLNRFVCEQAAYNLMDRRAERELVPAAQSYGLGLIPWAPLASGILSGKYRRGQPWPEGARLTAESGRGRQFGDQAEKVIQGLSELAQAKGCSISQLALAWLMNQPGITAPIIGPRTMDHLSDNLGAANVRVTDEDRKAIDALVPPCGHLMTYYEGNFAPPKHRW